MLRCPRHQAKPPRLDHRAAVHYHGDPRRTGQYRGVLVDHPKLHPDHFGAQPDRIVDHAADMRR